MEDRRKLTTNELTEITAAARMADKLAALVLENQRTVECILYRLEAMHWPENIFGEMENCISRRDYEKIEKMLVEWEQCTKADLPAAKETMKKTATLIRAFVEFFKKTNGMVK